ncbi:enoyl-CoA hydratase/isomerase family protein [Thiolinea disciformis]|uniref:enoyl-CoA hydratase/isomerase family protein n=1 Tax=Thiolinea disciformis TaxID=125614 RepID=UPI00037E9F20|nr:enoyl-CoA hydratase/isomerase family protein [Thiolinea disciformis]
MFTTLEIEAQASVAYVWMNRPEVHNAFNAQLISDLNATFEQLNTEESVRVIVLGGRGKSFSAGADLNWMKAAGEASVEANQADALRLATMLHSIATCSKPTIARVHGAALGGGMGLASACDICIASEAASFATSEVKFGIIPATISPYVLRAIGERQAYRYFQTAERINAQRALQIGLVHELVAAEHLDAKVQEIVAALLAGGPQAQAAAKQLIVAVAHKPVTESVLVDTAERIAQLRSTPEAREGLAAFLEKRPASWINPKE